MAVDNWALLDTKIITLSPSEEEIEGWKLLDTKIITLSPSEEEIEGWKLLDTKIVTLSLPTIECSTDADCPEGYVCVGGVCVKKKAGLPLAPFALGGAAAVGIILISSRKKEQKGK
jgi:hypothetical protein